MGRRNRRFAGYYYLEEHLQFPFQASCVGECQTAPLAVSDVVNVRGIPSEEVCEHEMFVNIAWHERLLAMRTWQRCFAVMQNAIKDGRRGSHVK